MWLRLLTLLTLLVIGTMSNAEEPSGLDESFDDSWKFILLPYMWLPANDLTIGTREFLQSDSISFSRALETYDYGGLIFFEAHKGPWAIYTDAMFVRLLEESRSWGLPVQSDIRQAMVELAIVRSVGKGRHTLDALFGIRYFNLKSDVRVRPVNRFQDTFSWIEPIVGLRHHMRLSEKWRYDWRLDFGGFGVGSRLTWQLNTNFHYDFDERYAINFGYRHLNIDYENGDKVYDAETTGPMIGFSVKF